MGTLYECKSGNHQGLIVEEETGRTVAVTYDKADAEPIIRAANSHAELLAALEELSGYSAADVDANEHLFSLARDRARAAIAKATA